MALAKGTTEDANARRVAVFRTIDGAAPGRGVRPDSDPPRPGTATRRSIPATSSSSTDRRSRRCRSRSCRAFRCFRSSVRSRRGILTIQASHVNNNLPFPTKARGRLRRIWPVAGGLRPGQRNYSATNILDLPTLLRIIQHWRWLMLGAVAGGLALAVLADTADARRSIEPGSRSKPTRRRLRSPTSNRASSRRRSTAYDFVATQVGLLASRASPSALRRTSISPTIPSSSTQDGDAAATACGRRPAWSPAASRSSPPEEGQADQVQLRFDLAATGGAWSPTASPTASSTPRSSAATKPRPMPAISSSGRSTRPAATLRRSERAAGRLCPEARDHQHRSAAADGKPASSDTNSLQGESLVALNQALAAGDRATGRAPKAPIASRWRSGQTADVDAEHVGAAPAAGDARGANISRSASS